MQVFTPQTFPVGFHNLKQACFPIETSLNIRLDAEDVTSKHLVFGLPTIS